MMFKFMVFKDLFELNWLTVINTNKTEIKFYFIIYSPIADLIRTAQLDTSTNDAVSVQNLYHLGKFFLDITLKLLISNRQCGEYILNNHRSTCLINFIIYHILSV